MEARGRRNQLLLSVGNFANARSGFRACAGGKTDSSDQTSLVLSWLGSRCSLTRSEAFSTQELKLPKGIGAVLDSRYGMIADTDRAEKTVRAFRGLPEDRYVSASIDGAHTHKTSGKGQGDLRLLAHLSQ